LKPEKSEGSADGASQQQQQRQQEQRQPTPTDSPTAPASPVHCAPVLADAHVAADGEDSNLPADFERPDRDHQQLPPLVAIRHVAPLPSAVDALRRATRSAAAAAVAADTPAEPDGAWCSQLLERWLSLTEAQLSRWAPKALWSAIHRDKLRDAATAESLLVAMGALQGWHFYHGQVRVHVCSLRAVRRADQ
jgi:hypothetical protein